MSNSILLRREILLAGLLVPIGLAAREEKGGHQGQEKPVGAVEDLMREHGILRRILLVYAEVIPKLEAGAADFDAGAIHQAANLFRTFGEDYHEKKLEEAFIFPAMRTNGPPPIVVMTQVLARQHDRGRQITDHILGATASGKVKTGLEKPLAEQMHNFVRMYLNHAAREDTILFPAWKKTLSQPKLDEMSDKFEGIEKQQFGTDGFDDASRKMVEIEEKLGLADLDHFTASAPTL